MIRYLSLLCCAFLVLVSACSSDGGSAEGGSDAGSTGDSGFSDIPFGVGPAYCRSLDTNWADAYTSDIDQELATIIDTQGLLGDPGISVNEDGDCVWRTLPTIDDPIAQLGRALFFSFDLSGDKNVACASCHHPALGGGDALSMSMGPVDDSNAMGADRARGITDVDAIHVPRNANTTFNIAFWDDGLFWDSRVQSLDSEAGENGDGAGIATPDSPYKVEDPDAGTNLTSAQARFPVTEEHEMAGSWAALHQDREGIRDGLVSRMITGWSDRFAALCDETGLPDSWVAACAEPAGEARDKALVTFPHIATAIGEYERSQNFTDSPWRAYVQGDVNAISDGAKRGALLFFQTLAEGGQNCFACHTGDFFTDELFHAVASPQIGPGKEAGGSDTGRALVTARFADNYRFRTPTLLNVSATAPYFHSGAYATLTRTVQHYDNQNGRLFEYFGEGNKSAEGARPWCQMTQFRDIPECNSLYKINNTHGGRVNNSTLDPAASNIQTLEDLNYVYLTAFLETLTDPTVLNAAAMAPWIDPDSTLQVTETSSEWGTVCDAQIERSADMNLHIKGFRWLLNGALANGDVNTGEPLYDTFGIDEWVHNRTRFTAETGIRQGADELSVAVLEVLTEPQRQVLLDAYSDMSFRNNRARIHELRNEVFEQMNAMRADGSVETNTLEDLIVAAAALEAEDMFDMAVAYRAVRDSLDPSGQDEQLAVLAAIEQGDLSMLPDGVFVPGDRRLNQSTNISRAVRQVGGNAGGGIPWDNFAAGYLTWSLGWDCRFTFMTRMDEGERRANYYGFSQWAREYLFDLGDGSPGSGGFQLEMSEYIGAEDERLGLSADFTDTLNNTLAIRTDYNAARADLVARLRDVHESDGSDADLKAAVVVANQAVGVQDAKLLIAELEYYIALWSALNTNGNSPLPGYLECIESPDTQSKKGNGGLGEKACQQ
ncbi:MAG: hypothetical protein GY820_10060 [Gammaproteobacteria bacterium]|nr:hypothetical protein [Gammaproteobacteria bacterium]